MAEIKIKVDMAELDAAASKAEKLSALLDDIEGRFSRLDQRKSMHPDEVVMLLAEVARRHGYGLRSCDLIAEALAASCQNINTGANL